MLAATAGAAFLVILYDAAEGVEEYTFARTRASIRSLLALALEEAAFIAYQTYV